jgi:archaellum component FlaG (FlaF/FlaG flagellin family)
MKSKRIFMAFAAALVAVGGVTAAVIFTISRDSNGVTSNGKWRTVVAAQATAAVTNFTLYDTGRNYGFRADGQNDGMNSILITRNIGAENTTYKTNGLSVFVKGEIHSVSDRKLFLGGENITPIAVGSALVPYYSNKSLTEVSATKVSLIFNQGALVLPNVTSPLRVEFRYKDIAKNEKTFSYTFELKKGDF